MSKAEEFIQNHTRNCSNTTYLTDDVENPEDYCPWLTPDQARKAVEIARKEMMEDIIFFLEGAHEYTDDKELQKKYDNEGLICDFRAFVRARYKLNE